MQTVPDRPVGLHHSLPIVAWIGWKLVMIIKGKWNFRSCDSKTNFVCGAVGRHQEVQHP